MNMAKEETGQEGNLTAKQQSELLATLHEHAQRSPRDDHALFPRAMYFVASGISSLIKEGHSLATQVESLDKKASGILTRLEGIDSESNPHHAAVMTAATDIIQNQNATLAKLLKAEEIGLIRQKQLYVMLLILGGLSIISIGLTLWMLLT